AGHGTASPNRVPTVHQMVIGSTIKHIEPVEAPRCHGWPRAELAAEVLLAAPGVPVPRAMEQMVVGSAIKHIESIGLPCSNRGTGGEDTAEILLTAPGQRSSGRAHSERYVVV